MPELSLKLTALFPQVISLGLARMTESTADTTAQKHFVTAFIDTSDDKHIAPDECQRLCEWLKVRLQADSLVVIEKRSYQP